MVSQLKEAAYLLMGEPGTDGPAEFPPFATDGLLPSGAPPS